jgi:uncharacterized protein involved in cysteine biosynthesis
MLIRLLLLLLIVRHTHVDGWLLGEVHHWLIWLSLIEKVNLLVSILSEALLLKREIGMTLAGCYAHTLSGLLSTQILVASSYAECIQCLKLRLTMRARDTSLKT